jgi:hypothetical protein
MKRFIAIALVLLLLFCFTTAYASAPGSSGDPLISLSYIHNSFLPAIQRDNKTLIDSSIGKLYSDAQNKLQETYDASVLQLGGYDGYAFAGTFTAVSLPAGTSAELVTGSIFILTAGTASLTINKGTVINISTGEEVGASASVTANQRYFCAENTSAQFSAAANAACLIDGYYKSNGTVIVNPVLFLDVSTTDWFYNAVKYASDNNLFNGTTAVTFSPQTSMTRGMFVTVLYRLAGKPAMNASSVFSDVAASQYYYNAVVWASTNNVAAGYSDGQFHPDDFITREQMAVILYRYASYAGYSQVYGNTSVFDSFPDKSEASSYAADALKWAAYNTLITGADGKLLPESTASRAQVAQIMHNFCQKIAGK